MCSLLQSETLEKPFLSQEKGILAKVRQNSECVKRDDPMSLGNSTSFF